MARPTVLKFAVGLRSAVEIANRRNNTSIPPAGERLDAALDGSWDDYLAMQEHGEGLIDEAMLAHLLMVSLSTVQHWRAKNIGPPFYKFGPPKKRRAPVRYLWSEVLLWMRATFHVRPINPMVPNMVTYKNGQMVNFEAAAYDDF